MIASLRGTLAQITAQGAVVDVHGVGYEVTMAASSAAALPQVGKEVALVVLTQVREDAITLYGFRSTQERDLYLALVSVSQIGPKLALQILGNIQPDELFDAIAGDDVKRLSMIPGVGKKSAARMVLELRDKLPTILDRDAIEATASTGGKAPSARDDLIEALTGLGFRTAEINAALRVIKPKSGEPLDDVLRRALVELSPRSS